MIFTYEVNLGQVLLLLGTMVTIIGTAVAAFVRIKVELVALRLDVTACAEKIGEIAGPPPGLLARVGFLEHDVANLLQAARKRPL